MKTLVVVGQQDFGFFDRCLELINQKAAKQRIEVTCRLVSSSEDLASTEDVSAHRGATYLFFGPHYAAAARSLQAVGRRVVMIGTPPLDEEVGVPVVRGDHERGGYLAAHHLIDLGHERIAYSNYYPERSPTHPRWLGFQRAAYQARLRSGRVTATYIEQAKILEWIAYPQLARDFLTSPGAPTGIAAWNDFEALRLLGILDRAGLSVPGDVSIIGYDALPQSEHSVPPLSTIDAGIEKQVEEAMDLLNSPSLDFDATYIIATPILIRRRINLGASGQLLIVDQVLAAASAIFDECVMKPHRGSDPRRFFRDKPRGCRAGPGS